MSEVYIHCTIHRNKDEQKSVDDEKKIIFFQFIKWKYLRFHLNVNLVQIAKDNYTAFSYQRCFHY